MALYAHPSKQRIVALRYFTLGRHARAGIDVISSSDPWRASKIITLIFGQLDGPRLEWAMRVCIQKH